MKSALISLRKMLSLLVAGAFLLALPSLFVSCSDGDDGDSGSGGSNGDAVVCTYIQSDDESTYYIFYADKTAEYYYNGELDKARDTICYEGDPMSSGTVKLKIAATGTTLITFKVSVSGGTVTAQGYIGESTFGGTKYIVKTGIGGNSGGSSGNSGTNGNSGGNNGNSSGSSGNSGTNGNSGANGGNNNNTAMFMGFDNVVTIANGTDIAEITNTIYSLTSDTTLKFTGGINSITLTTLASAMGTNDSVNIALDFSETAGITEWSNKLAGQKTLYAISLPKTVTNVQSDAFMDCTKLRAITVPFGIESYPSVSSDDVIVNFAGTLVDWLNSSAKLPSGKTLYLNGEALIGTVTIPNSITTIRNGAFKNCSQITDIIIPDSVMNIGDSSFYGCSGLTSITIPDSVTSIGSSAFYDCSELMSITIPSSVMSIEDSSFYGCSSLTSVTIPYGVTSIGRNAFYGCSELMSITIPSSVMSIEDSSFYGCSGLTSITIPDSVTSIGSSAFGGCSSLEEITIPFVGRSADTTSASSGLFGYIFGTNSYTDGIRTDQYYSSDYYDYQYYYIPKTLKKVTVTGGNLSYGAFYGCSNLTDITIPDNITSIGDRAFYGCSGLMTISIPDSLTSIGSRAFYGCSELASIYYKGTVSDWVNISFSADSNPCIYGAELYINGTTLTEVEIPSTEINIGDYTFQGCKSITSVIIHYGVMSIGNGAFSGCSGLTSITMPDSVTSIGNTVFSGCTGLTSITIPNSVTSIGNSVFNDCTALKDLIIADGQEILLLGYNTYNSSGTGGEGLFYDCPLETVYLGRTIAYSSYSNNYGTTYAYESYPARYGYSAFYRMDTMYSLQISDSVTSIGMYAFYGCSGLTRVDVPMYVTSIGNSAFQECSELTFVSIPEVIMTIGERAFYGCTKLTAVQSYGYENMAMPNSTSIGDYAFYGCSSLESRDMLVNTLTNIGNCAFYNCSGFNSIRIPKSVISIGNSAFYGCSGLELVYYTGSEAEWALISIGSNNTSLTQATIAYDSY